MYWTKKHDEVYNLRFNLKGSASLLARYINRRTKGDTAEEIEIDLREFNKWVGKKRTPYDRKTLKLAIAKLFDRTEGLIVCWKQINWYYYKIIVKPISFLDEKKTQESEQSPNSETIECPSYNVPEKRGSLQQQHNINQLNTILGKVGLKYDSDALLRIWRLSGKSLTRVREVVELMLYRHRSNPVRKAHGFIIDALKHNWQCGFNPFYEPDLPKFASIPDLVKFTDAVFDQPMKT